MSPPELFSPVPANRVDVAKRPDAAGRPEIVVREKGTTTELIVRGDRDLAQQLAADGAIQAVLQRCPERVVLDLSQQSDIDASGISELLKLHRRCMHQHVGLLIIPGPGNVAPLMEICGVTTGELLWLRASA